MWILKDETCPAGYADKIKFLLPFQFSLSHINEYFL